MNKRMRSETFAAKDLEFVGKAPPPDSPPLQVGDWCHLTSGSARLLVVDVFRNSVIIGLPGGEEDELPRACVRRGAA